MHFAGSNPATDPKCPKCSYKISKNFRVEKSGEISAFSWFRARVHAPLAMMGVALDRYLPGGNAMLANAPMYPCLLLIPFSLYRKMDCDLAIFFIYVNFCTPLLITIIEFLMFKIFR